MPLPKEAQGIVGILQEWNRGGDPLPGRERICRWLEGTEGDRKTEPLMDLLGWIGLTPELRPLGLELQEELHRLTLVELARIAGRRIVFPLMINQYARLAGATIRETIIGGSRKQFEVISQGVSRLKPDIAMCNFGGIPLSSMGCKVSLPDDSPPMVVSHPIKSWEDLERLRPLDPAQDGRWPDFIHTTRLFAQGFTLLRCALTVGPFSLAGMLMGVEDITKKTFKDPALVKRVLDYATEIIIADANAHVKAGANLVMVGDPTSSLLSAKAYQEFVAPCVRRVVEGVRGALLVLHVCGNTGHLIGQMAATGVQGLSLDAYVDLAAVASQVPPTVAVMGNLSPLKALFTGTPEEVRRDTREMLDHMREVPNYIVMSGCEIPPAASGENVEAFIETVKAYR
ncbi:MAG: uroporphyrinogen decarboxylase family protein [Nitrospinae bacterium]|nr:uroporphyrinogen decarboxylase family protein [Nitrospinota bacterium]